MARNCGLPEAITVDMLDTVETGGIAAQLHCNLMRGIEKRIQISPPEPCPTETVIHPRLHVNIHYHLSDID